jgi:hypothetical protein
MKLLYAEKRLRSDVFSVERIAAPVTPSKQSKSPSHRYRFTPSDNLRLHHRMESSKIDWHQESPYVERKSPWGQDKNARGASLVKTKAHEMYST